MSGPVFKPDVNPIFRDMRPDGTMIEGPRGGVTHLHEIPAGSGIGHITDERIPPGEPGHIITTVNNSNQKILENLPDWMKK